MNIVVGIPACAKSVDDLQAHVAPARYAEALMGGAGALPVLLPPVGAEMLAILDRLDGLLLSGSPSNVEPHLYGEAEDLTPGAHDPRRDATTLPLVRAAIDRGIPVLAICRGIQELNVALGGTLLQRVQEVPGRLDHRWGEAERTPEYWFRPQHKVSVTGQLARIVGAGEIAVNSLHQQAIDRPADALVVEATAPDGTIEAVRVGGAPGWAFGVQWHPEWNFRTDASSAAIFRAFGDACRAYAAGLRQAA
jgi:putative glutamine amidotransferase